MRLRILISGVLILTLSPVFSFAASCNLSCGMRPEILRLFPPSASTEPAHALHHHHMTPARRSDEDAVDAITHRVSADHTCCNGNQFGISAFCLSLQGRLISKPSASPGSGATVAVRTAIIPLASSEPSQRRAFRNPGLLAVLSRSLPLRI